MNERERERERESECVRESEYNKINRNCRICLNKMVFVWSPDVSIATPPAPPNNLYSTMNMTHNETYDLGRISYILIGSTGYKICDMNVFTWTSSAGLLPNDPNLGTKKPRYYIRAIMDLVWVRSIFGVNVLVQYSRFRTVPDVLDLMNR